MIQDLKTILRKNGHKATKSRLAILSAFSKKHIPVTAESIFKKVEKTGMDLVTVYRTLSSFEKSGLIKRVDLHQDALHFELNDDHHHHFVCNNCGKVEDFEDSQIEKAVKRIVGASKFGRAIDHSFEIFGVCKNCVKI